MLSMGCSLTSPVKDPDIVATCLSSWETLYPHHPWFSSEMTKPNS
jgi:hypothetical protein